MSASVTRPELIEAVIPWANGSDLAWLAERRKYRIPKNADESSARYRTWGLLELCLLSLLRNADWLCRITIVTSGKEPSNLAEIQEVNPAIPIRIVREEEFIPHRYLPTFSAFTVESCLHLIPDLTERFLLLNDDMYFERPSSREDYLSPSGLTIFSREFESSAVLFRSSEEQLRAGRWFNELTLSGMWRRIRRRINAHSDQFSQAIRRSKRLYRSKFSGGSAITPAHFPIVLKKADLKILSEMFAEEFDLCRQDRFRGPNAIDMHCMALNYAVDQGNVFFRPRLQLFIQLRSESPHMQEELNESAKYSVVCINDDVRGEVPADLARMVEQFVRSRCDRFRSGNFE